ncbi:hypothetical protein ILUMI_16057, partial [Ignelater luminosus]
YSFQFQVMNTIKICFLTTQLAFYCIPASYIADEALTVSNAIYFSKWYLNNFPSLKAPLLLMIQNSQNEIIIKAGGLITFNAETVVK